MSARTEHQLRPASHGCGLNQARSSWCHDSFQAIPAALTGFGIPVYRVEPAATAASGDGNSSTTAPTGISTTTRSTSSFDSRSTGPHATMHTHGTPGLAT